MLSDEESDDEGNNNDNLTNNPAAHLLMAFIILWGFIFHVSNAALNVLILFVNHFLKIISPKSTATDLCPKSLKAVQKYLKLSTDEFIQYVVCPKCDSVYELQACISKQLHGQLTAKQCVHIQFPHHPCYIYRQPCGTPLLHKVCRGSNVQFQPYKVYLYQPITKTLTRLCNRSNFLLMCERWRQLTAYTEYMSDVYDGNIWKEWQCWKGRNFLSLPYSLATTLNLDWFQPYTHVNYSVGVFYMVILNLPREERYKIENIVLLAIIPGPREPKLTVNSFLGPLVEELKDLWEGVPISLASKETVIVQLAVVCIACDIPAVRKLCGFASHSATLGCSKCKHTFSNETRSDFDRTTWEPRTLDQHKKDANDYLGAKTGSQQAELLSKNGVRYSLLLELPYLDIVRFHTIDPMHNILLGTSKHVMKTWIKNEILTSQQLQIIEGRVSKIQSPYDVGRLPLKISSTFAGFTADQWLNWTLVYSAVALKGLLPQAHYNCWLLYIRACTILCCKLIKKSDVYAADQYLHQFCRNFAALCGAEACTPNMHLHLHLKGSILDYGPVYAFWLYSFERFNGVLGNYSTNNKNIEVQLMRKFINQQKAKDIHFPEEYQYLYETLFKTLNHGSLHHTFTPSSVLEWKCMSTGPITEIDTFQITKHIKILQPISKRALNMTECKYLETVYQQLYPAKQIDNLSHFYLHANKVVLNDDIIGSVCSRNKKASVIGAYWPSKGSTLSSIDYTQLQIGTIQHFLEHKITLKDDSGTSVELCHLFCYVKWFISHPQRNWFGTSAIVTDLSQEADYPLMFMPVQRIVCRCAHASMSLDFPTGKEQVMIAIPLTRHFHSLPTTN